MSETVRVNEAYLTLLLNTPSKKQAVLLLSSATKEQIHALSEIALNLLHLPLGKEASKEVNKRRRLLEKLADKKLSFKRKGQLIKKHHRSMIDVLHPVREQILRLAK